MSDTITQANRLLEAITPAGTDVLLLHSFSGSEGVSRPFRFTLKLVADVMNNMPAQVTPSSIVGQPMGLRITLSDPNSASSGQRYISGMCERFSVEDADDEFAHYTAVVVPWFSFLNYFSNCRIFQDMAVPDIISKIVSDAGFSSQFQNNTTKTYTTWDYCVQYRETDFNFISRLMEHEGIYYYFEHTESSHTMILADAPSCYTSLPEQSSFRYSPVTGVSPMEDTIRRWHLEEEVHPGKWTMRDYHHEMPSSTLEVTTTSTSDVSSASNYEIYDYPGDYAKKFNDPSSRLGDVIPEGQKLDDLRIAKEETPYQVAGGISRCRAFCTGYKVTVTGGAAAGTYLLTEVEHSAVQQPAYRSRDNVGFAYENRFRAITSTVPYVPEHRAPKPVVYGLQTALVVDETSGGNSEEIWPDKYGRVRVRFHWDRENKYSCWLRVVQPWAGKMWGHQWIPRTGDEVAVAFAEGDPDVPYVIGSVYNSTNMPIFTLPDNKTQSGIQTHSSTGGGASDYNMLRFEDLNGSEEVYFQAQKDLNSLIKNNETRKVRDGSRTTTIHVNDARTVETGNDTIDVQQGNRTITVDQGNISETAKMGNISVTANMGNISTKADLGNISTTASAGTISISADAQSVSVTGMTEVTLTCGASSISLTPASISITAPIVNINS
ncbi:MAG: type VI secretion system tip protein TssI/VgrG [Bryobacteraceae bacterium]